MKHQSRQSWHQDPSYRSAQIVILSEDLKLTSVPAKRVPSNPPQSVDVVSQELFDASQQMVSLPALSFWDHQFILVHKRHLLGAANLCLFGLTHLLLGRQIVLRQEARLRSLGFQLRRGKAHGHEKSKPNYPTLTTSTINLNQNQQENK